MLNSIEARKRLVCCHGGCGLASEKKMLNFIVAVHTHTHKKKEKRGKEEKRERESKKGEFCLSHEKKKKKGNYKKKGKKGI
jgi:hypothetical protein